MSNKTKLTYNSAFNELQEIVGLLQNEAINMDDLSEKVKRAAFLIQFCRERLRLAESEIQGIFDEKPKSLD
jgi:exodeoxyribonuclease VII small subunit